jgi:hypothetical protein
MRLGKFHQQLLDWAERSCVLTVTFASTGGQIRFAGVLRPYYSLHSLRGWALVPPVQHGGFESLRLTPLNLDEATTRLVLGDGADRRLQFAADEECVFQLERDRTVFTAPPRTTGDGRYLYVGGRRRPAPEPWMLH